MENTIQDIPKSMEKFFGCSGRMIKPSSETVKALIRKIRKGKLATLNQLRDKIANDFEVQAACPASTLKALQVLSVDDKPVCYWRVLKPKGELISKFPGGVEAHGMLLEKEGFSIDYTKKHPFVVDYASRLIDFG